MMHTREGVYFLHFPHSACTVIHLHPDHQPVLGASCHFVEELQALEGSLGVEGPGFQQSRLLGFSSHSAEVHEVPSI